MTATDELRRMLDERGVEWTVPDESWNQSCITYWTFGGIKWVAFEIESNMLLLNASSIGGLTPEQAIAATLGIGTCHKVLDFDGTAWICSECGEHIGPRRWNFCPNCGRRIEVGE